MMELLAKFADPAVIATLPLTDKMLAGLATTVLGMGITFAALAVLQLVIIAMDKLLNPKAKVTVQAAISASTAKPLQPRPRPQQEQELIAVITAVIATQLHTSPGRVIIKNIEPMPNHGPTWGRAGIIDQMNNRL